MKSTEERAQQEARYVVAEAAGTMGATSAYHVQLQIFAQNAANRSEGIYPATLRLSGPGPTRTATIDGVLRGLGEHRAVVLSTHFDGRWVDALRGNWMERSREFVGVWLPLKAAAVVGALYADKRRSRTPEMRVKADEGIDAVKREYGKPVVMKATFGDQLFKRDDRPEAQTSIVTKQMFGR